MAKSQLKTEGRTITVRVPISIRKRGGRKVVLAPSGAPHNAVLMCQRADNAMIKAIARAFRWREMLEAGKYATIKEIAKADQINESYLSRMLRLTLLAPDVVEAILEGRQPQTCTLAKLMRRFPVLWANQRIEIGG